VREAWEVAGNEIAAKRNSGRIVIHTLINFFIDFLVVFIYI